jgi:hypothetical protein
MAKSISFVQYMRAHGNTPGPTQRPILAGALTALIAEIPAAGMLWWSGALSSVTENLSLGLWVILALHLATMIAAGAIYGRVFSRAANDVRGGWLFGISYGFLIWMVGPVTVLQWLIDRPVALGFAAMGILGAHLIYGLVLGLLFPPVHKSLQCELRQLKEPAQRGSFAVSQKQHRLSSRGN